MIQSKTAPKTPKKPAKQSRLITKDANLADVVFKYPQVAEVLLDHGLHCVGCMASSFDTIEAGAKVHGMSDEDIAKMLDRINEVVAHRE